MSGKGYDDSLWGSDSDEVGNKGPHLGDDESDTDVPFPLKASTKGKKKDSLRKALGKVEKANMRLVFGQVKQRPPATETLPRSSVFLSSEEVTSVQSMMAAKMPGL